MGRTKTVLPKDRVLLDKTTSFNQVRHMSHPSASLETELLAGLLDQWGYVMGSAGLRMALGFATQQALRHAIQAGHVPFPVFTLKGRKGPFARTHDVAAWLGSHAADAAVFSPAARADESATRTKRARRPAAR